MAHEDSYPYCLLQVMRNQGEKNNPDRQKKYASSIEIGKRNKK